MAEIRTTNPLYVQGGAGLRGVQHPFVDPKNANPGCYINPLLAGGTFISKLGIALDGVNLEEIEGSTDQTFMYTALNRIYCTDGIRKEKYSEGENVRK